MEQELWVSHLLQAESWIQICSLNGSCCPLFVCSASSTKSDVCRQRSHLCNSFAESHPRFTETCFERSQRLCEHERWVSHLLKSEPVEVALYFYLNNVCRPSFICLVGSTLNQAPPNPTFVTSASVHTSANAHTFATPLENLTHASQRLALNPNAYTNTSGESLICWNRSWVKLLCTFTSIMFVVLCSSV